MKVRDFYDVINGYAPFDRCWDSDNCGLNVGDMDADVRAVCVCLDITGAVIDEALKRNANLLISHHPVIFSPIKTLRPSDPAYRLAQNGLNAICAHTNADITENGVTDLMAELLGFGAPAAVLEPVFPDGTGYGRVYDLPIPSSSRALAESCKEAFGCTVVRYTETERPIKRAALCSGSGGGNLGSALRLGCDALITGDVKHDVWISAQNADFCVIDAGHYHTENILCNHLLGLLSRKFPGEEIFRAESGKDPCGYVCD